MWSIYALGSAFFAGITAILAKIGIKNTDISYGNSESNKFDLYLPKDNSKANYGLVVYLVCVGSLIC